MRSFSLFRLDHTSHSFNQGSLAAYNWFCDSRIAGVTSQDFNTPLYIPCIVFVEKIDWADSLMVSSRVMLGRIVSKIVFTRFPEDFELTL